MTIYYLHMSHIAIPELQSLQGTKIEALEVVGAVKVVQALIQARLDLRYRTVQKVLNKDFNRFNGAVEVRHMHRGYVATVWLTTTPVQAVAN